jgi:hypothetical protein
LLSQVAGAQQQPESPKGFWVLEGNPKAQSYVVVRYYSSDRKLIGEEVINKPWIDIRKRRNIRKLDRLLAGRLASDSSLKAASLVKRKQ